MRLSNARWKAKVARKKGLAFYHSLQALMALVCSDWYVLLKTRVGKPQTRVKSLQYSDTRTVCEISKLDQATF